ncbi:MAG: hypothetical protein MZW92_75820 [Comamonadaceae bacterium]|nr:hypothetical protein [Comamonadaceae bacterium]
MAGKALRFDGQTTAVVRPAAKMPRIGGAFCGRSLGRPSDLSLDLVRDRQPGEGPPGRLLLRHRSRGPVRAPARRRADGGWRCRSDVRLPLYAWNHILGDLRSGHRHQALPERQAGRRQKAVPGRPPSRRRSTPGSGATRRLSASARRSRSSRRWPSPSTGSSTRSGSTTRALGRADVEAALASAHAVRPDAARRRRSCRSGPKGPGRFGAYYTRLRYAEEWENPWRVGDAADVVVRFDETPNRLVFWRGTSYIPAWVTENGIWYTNEFYETQVPTDGDERRAHGRQAGPLLAPPGSSRATTPGSSCSGATRRSRVNYDLVNVDPLTGWGDWVEETYTVYPDGTCVRKIKVWSSKPRVDPAEGQGLE